MGPEWVAPLVAWLASPACDRTHRYYSCVKGRYAEVFIGVAPGWSAPADAPPSPAELLAALPTIEDRDGFEVPSSTFDEILRVDARRSDASG
jgi:hypothetical protein